MGTDLIVLIPARRGSSRVKNKNMRTIGGKSLIERSVDFCIEHNLHNVVVYTDYDADEVGIDAAFLMERPASDATDGALAEDYITQFISKRNLHDELILLLQPTSPFRSGKVLRQLLEAGKYLSNGSLLTTVHRVFDTIWSEEDGIMKPLRPLEIRRQQDKRPYLVEDGNMYLFRASDFLNLQSLSNFTWHAIDNEFPHTLDINTEDDIVLSELIARHWSC